LNVEVQVPSPQLAPCLQADWHFAEHIDQVPHLPTQLTCPFGGGGGGVLALHVAQQTSLNSVHPFPSWGRPPAAAAAEHDLTLPGPDANRPAQTALIRESLSVPAPVQVCSHTEVHAVILHPFPESEALAAAQSFGAAHGPKD